jgi:hypothetical protein
MHVPGRSEFAGARRGREAVLGYIRAVVELADAGVEVELIDVLAGGGDRVAVLLRERLSGARGELRMRRERLHRSRPPDRRDPHLRARPVRRRRVPGAVRRMGALELMDRYIAAVRRGDWDSAYTFFADDVVPHVPGARRSRASCAGAPRRSPTSNASRTTRGS